MLKVKKLVEGKVFMVKGWIAELQSKSNLGLRKEQSWCHQMALLRVAKINKFTVPFLEQVMA